jgi:uncharacterized membrane protein
MESFGDMHELIFAGALFLIAHLGISSTPLRGVLVRAMGERVYLGFYSTMAVVTLVYLILTYNGASHAEFLWLPDPTSRWIALLIMPVALIFMLGGFLTRNPTAVGQEAQAKVVGEGAGLVRITRHPFQWAVVLWAIAHIVANADAASLIFFGSLGLLSLAGSFLIDAKKSHTMGADWTAFARVTSNIPFAAILSGRNRLVVSELWLPVAVGLVGYAVVVWGHAYVSGIPLF